MIAAVRSVVPFGLRVELVRLRRYPSWLAETPRIARGRVDDVGRGEFGHVLDRHETPLCRDPGLAGSRLQRGKESNVALVAGLLDGRLVRPSETFSYHRAVGRPSRRRGFVPGLEMHRTEKAEGLGGGACSVSNLLYLVALRSGMNIVERHRHGLDLFPDHDRTVPFGCGATVFYNVADLRFSNPLDQDVMLALWVEDGRLIGELRAIHDPGWRASVHEVDHWFRRDGAAWYRENRIRRRITTLDGEVLSDREVAHNVGRCLYDPESG